MLQICDTYLDCSEEKRVLFLKNGYSIDECSQCSHRFTEINNIENHLSKVYSDDYFFEGGAGYPNYLEEKEILINAGKRYARILSRYTKTGNLLDVGCAAGFIMKGFEEAGWKCEGVEPNDTMASYGRDEMKLNIHTGSLEEFTTNNRYDVISLIEVIGHFYDLEKAIKSVSNLLNEGGLVLVESWNMDSMFAKLMGRKWHEYSPPSVIHWFSDATISNLFDKMGFQLVDKGYPSKRINIKHAFSLLEEDLPDFIRKRQILSRLASKAGKFTLIYPMHDLKWYLFRKKMSETTLK